jgi:arylsulfatase A-like enzyme
MAFSGGPFTSGGRKTDLVSLVDVAPTLLDAAGIAVPEHMEGRSLLELSRPESQSWRDEVFVQISEAQVGRAVRTGRWKYSVSDPDTGGRDAPNSEVYHEEFLYDLLHDPYEQTNLIHSDAHEGVIERMKQRLLTNIRAIEGYQPRIVSAERSRFGQRHVSEDEARS